MSKFKKTYSIFISFINEEMELAVILNEGLKAAFGDNVETFLYHRIAHGQRWEEVILDKIKSCDAILQLISHRSINRKWIILEFGAFWAYRLNDEEKDVYPILHGDFDFTELYFPLSKYIGSHITKTDDDSLYGFFDDLRKKLGLRTFKQRFDFDDIKSRLKDISFQLQKSFGFEVVRDNSILSEINRIDALCKLGCKDKEIHQIIFSDDDVLMLSHAIRGYRFIDTGKILIINGDVKSVATIKLNLTDKIATKDYLFVRAIDTERSESRKVDTLFKLELGEVENKLLKTTVLNTPLCLDYQRNREDREYINKKDDIFVFDVAGLGVGKSVTIEMVFWQINLVDLKLSFYIIE